MAFSTIDPIVDIDYFFTHVRIYDESGIERTREIVSAKTTTGGRRVLCRSCRAAHCLPSAVPDGAYGLRVTTNVNGKHGSSQAGRSESSGGGFRRERYTVSR